MVIPFSLHRLFHRLHFWGGLIGAPIVLFAALTGLLYVFTPQIESWRHGHLDTVPVGAQVLPLDQQVEAALAVDPDAALRHVVPGFAPGDSTQVFLRAPHEHHAGASHDHGLPTGSIVYVDPYTGRVLGQLPEMARFKTWAKKLHSSALQGQGWRWLLELGASWMLVLALTGLAMWWPKPQRAGGPGWRALVPRLGRGRTTWRDLHATVTITCGLVLAIVLVTGLTWSKHAGERFRQLQQAAGQEAPQVPRALHSVPGDAPQVSWQAAWTRARAEAPAVSLQITAPLTDEGVWHVENFDRSLPSRRFVMALDARTGETLFHSGWAQLPVLAKATAVGIPFHRGEYGVWNQVLLAIAALAAVFSVVSGLTMWWLRRPQGALAAPPLSPADLRGVPLRWWAVLAALALAMPVFGTSLLVMAGLEGLRWLTGRWAGWA